MAATTAKDSAKWTWRGLVERLGAKRSKAISDYGELIDRLAAGEEIADSVVEAALSKAGKSPYDLASDVATKAERMEWAAEIERLQAVAADADAATGEIEAMIRAHNAAVEKLVADLQSRRAPVQERAWKGDQARGRIGELQAKLATGCPEHLREQQAALREELSEAVDALDQQDSFLFDHRTKLRKLIDSANDTTDGQEQAAQAEASLRHEEQQRAKLAARVAELQRQMDEIEAAKVRP